MFLWRRKRSRKRQGLFPVHSHTSRAIANIPKRTIQLWRMPMRTIFQRYSGPMESVVWKLQSCYDLQVPRNIARLFTISLSVRFMPLRRHSAGCQRPAVVLARAALRGAAGVSIWSTANPGLVDDRIIAPATHCIGIAQFPICSGFLF